MWIDLPFDINIIFFKMSTPFAFYAISNAKFISIIYFILLKMYHEIKIHKHKVESTGILSDQLDHVSYLYY